MPHSIEVFTPRTEAQSKQVTNNLVQLQSKGLKRCSITQSLHDTNAINSTNFLRSLQDKLDLDFVIHATSTATTCEGLKQRFEDWQSLGVSKLLCLRGDLKPSQQKGPRSIAEYSSIDMIKKAQTNGFEAWASAYPNPHQSSLSEQAGLDWTFRKLDAGATTLVTQFCFDTDKILEWFQKIKARFPETKVLVGILPIRSVGQIRRIHNMNDLAVPQSIQQFCGDHSDKNGNIPMEATKNQIQLTCQKLSTEKQLGFHFYSFNQLSPADWAIEQDFAQPSLQKIANNLYEEPTDVYSIKHAA